MALPVTDQEINLGNLPLTANLVLRKRTTSWWRGHLTYTDATDTAADLDLTTHAPTVARICLQDAALSCTYFDLATLTATGHFDIRLDPSDMEDLVAGEYLWYCEIILPADHAQLPSAVLRVFEGSAQVLDQPPTSSSSSSSSSSS